MENRSVKVKDQRKEIWCDHLQYLLERDFSSGGRISYKFMYWADYVKERIRKHRQMTWGAFFQNYKEVDYDLLSHKNTNRNEKTT